MAGAVEDLLTDPAKRERMGGAGRKRACEVFALPRYVREFEDLYTKLTATAKAKNRP
jgi:glycosyltransferase involved in cell wall biosynthesis